MSLLKQSVNTNRIVVCKFQIINQAVRSKCARQKSFIGQSKNDTDSIKRNLMHQNRVEKNVKNKLVRDVISVMMCAARKSN